MARRLARCILRLRPDERRRDSAQDVSRFFLLAHHENRPRHPERSRRVNAAWYVVLDSRLRGNDTVLFCLSSPHVPLLDSAHERDSQSGTFRGDPESEK